MKPPFSHSITLLAVMAALPRASAVSIGGTAVPQSRSVMSTGMVSRTLPMTARPIAEVGRSSNSLWDLSDSWEEEPYTASYILYGDTLLSETVDGQRRWYRIGSDSVTLVREESLLHRCIPDPPLPTNAVHAGKAPVATSGHPYSAKGTDSRDFRLDRTGAYSSMPAVRGMLVTAPGDTLDVFMTVEETVFGDSVTPGHAGGSGTATTLPVTDATSDTAGAPAPVPTHTFTRYRWFPASGGCLPVAIQTEETVTTGGDMETVRYAHITDPVTIEEAGTLRKDVPSGTDAGRLLSEARIECSGGEITISTDFPGAAGIRVNIASESGIPFHSGEATLSPDAPVSIPCGSFHPGRYIVAIGCGGQIEKRVVTVR